MKRKNLTILTLVFCLALLGSFLGFRQAEAQTSPATAPAKTATPTPTVSPTPNIDDPDEVIKIDTELVNLNVRVVDRNNRSIGSLTKNDFKVFEDNVPQQIDSFSKGEVPTNYAMVIDNSGSMRQQLDKVIEASKIVINTNKTEDETEIIRFISRDKISVEQEFTSNKNDLIDTLDNLYVEGGQTAIIDAIYLAAQRVDEYEKTRNPNDRKRRALILISDGEDRESYYKDTQLFELLRETDVQIYAIGFVNELSKEGGFISKSPQGKAKEFLERLAKETGGKVYFPNSLSELNGIAQDIATELRTQYILSYYPTDDTRDGRFKNIKVQVTDGPNKEKRIAITKTGRKTDAGSTTTPTLQNTKVKNQ